MNDEAEFPINEDHYNQLKKEVTMAKKKKVKAKKKKTKKRKAKK
jgi:hypothetical protein